MYSATVVIQWFTPRHLFHYQISNCSILLKLFFVIPDRPDQCRLPVTVGKFRPVFQDGSEFPHQWGHSDPSPETGRNIPTYGSDQIHGGEIPTRFLKRVGISPPVGTFRPVSRNGSEYPHLWLQSNPWWGNSDPFFETGRNIPTSGDIQTRLTRRV